MKYILINNWQKFQQYKDRRPDWIKLLIEIIEPFDKNGLPKKFHKMADSAKLTFILLACLRANYLQQIPYPSDKWLKERLGITALNIQPLIDNGFISVKSDSVQNCTELYGNATPEKEKERDTDTEKEREKEKEIQGSCFPENLDNQRFKDAWNLWNVYRKEIKKPLTPTAQKQQLKFLSERGNDAVAIIEKSIQNSWQGLFDLDKGTKNGRSGISQNQSAVAGTAEKFSEQKSAYGETIDV